MKFSALVFELKMLDEVKTSISSDASWIYQERELECHISFNVAWYPDLSHNVIDSKSLLKLFFVADTLNDNPKRFENIMHSTTSWDIFKVINKKSISQ